MILRRGFLTGLIAAPLVIRTPGLLMPIKPVVERNAVTLYLGFGAYDEVTAVAVAGGGPVVHVRGSGLMRGDLFELSDLGVLSGVYRVV